MYQFKSFSSSAPKLPATRNAAVEAMSAFDMVQRKWRSRSSSAAAFARARMRKLKIDWAKVKEAQRETAAKEVRASLLLGKISEREAIHATRDEVDREVEKAARQQRKPVAAVHMELEKNGTLGRIASHIQTEKTLNFLFEHSRKTAEDNAAEETS